MNELASRLLLRALCAGLARLEPVPGERYVWLCLGETRSLLPLDERGLPELHCFHWAALEQAFHQAAVAAGVTAQKEAA